MASEPVSQSWHYGEKGKHMVTTLLFPIRAHNLYPDLPISMFFGVWGKLEYLKESQANMGRAYKLHADVVLGGIYTQDPSAAREH